MHFTLLSIITAFCPWTDCTSVLLKKIFPDSNEAKKCSSGRTKTEKVVTSVLTQYSFDAVLKSFEENDIAYFGVATDGSNHNELKLFSIIFQYFDWRKGGLQSKLIELTNKANETAGAIASYVKDTLKTAILCLEDFGVMNKETMCLQS